MSSGKPTEDRSTCTACRGTGRLTSSLGGEPHQVTCPWCGGTGRFEAGRDAQQAPAEQASAAPAEPGGASAEGPAEPAPSSE